MEEVTTFLQYALLLLLFYIAYWYLGGPWRLPPGSAGIPFFGYLPFMGKDAHVTFEKLQKKYGNVFHLYLGSRLVVVLNDYEAIKEAFIKQADIFAGRPPDGNFQIQKNDNFGVVATDGEYWKQHRRFILSNLRDYGVGKLVLEPLILNEIHHFLEEIKKSDGKVIQIKPLLGNSLANNIHILVTGKRYEYGHPLLKELYDLLKSGEGELPQLNPLMFFPWLHRMPGFGLIINKNKIVEIIQGILTIMTKVLHEARVGYQEGERGIYIHDYLNEKKQRQKINSEENVFSEIGLLHNTRDLLLAGTETSSTTLHWALLYMTVYPEIQKKLQAEIDGVIGRHREPCFNDRANLPYVEATLQELHRIISLVPLSVPHRNIRNTEVLGKFIPKDAVIFPNIWAVHNDKKIWGDPQNFRPERFITPDGQFEKSEFVIPFSIGIVATDGEYWKQHRRFILTNLRDYGVGKLLLEPLLLNEIHHFLAEIKKDENKSFPIKPLLMNSLANNIHILITGKRYDYGDPVMKEICQISKAGERAIQHVSLFTFFPWMRFVPGSAMLTNRKKARAVLERILEITKNILNDVKTEFKDGESGIYIHAYLTEQRNRKKLNDEENIFTATGLHHITRDLLMAGTETSATTLHWSLLYLTRHPEVQEKLQKEIDQVIGKEREPSFNDRTKMPYTEAVICEVHRVISLVPMSFPHRTIRDTQIDGSFIPKDTLIIPNIYAVHNDEKIWGDPHNFRPERFISPEGQFVKSEHVIPFSIGKRACAGEPLARMELFLYLVCLFQHFTFVPPDGVMPSLDSVNGIIQRPVFQNICAISRD